MIRFLNIAIFVSFCILVIGCENQTPPKATADQNALASPASAPEAPTTLSKPASVPDFSLPSLNGEKLNMSDYKGMVVLINFWATWCGPCRYEIPDLIELQEEFGPDKFTILGISEDDGDIEMVKEFVKETNINYPIALDTDGRVAEAFGGVYALPATFVVDQAGRISHRTYGIFPAEAFKSDLKTMLGE